MTLRLRRWQGKWIAEDKTAGYFAELTDCDAATVAADFHHAESIRLRVEAAKDPEVLTRLTSRQSLQPRSRISSTEAV